MKYIIEFEDEYSMNEGGMKYHQCKQVPYWSVSHGIIKKLTPYTEPDRKAIEDEVWGLANYMGRMSLTERDLCFGFPLPQEVTMNLSYNEAKSKYEAWLKQKDEICVGDEVVAANGLSNGFVTRIDEYKDANIVWEMGGTGCVNTALLKKTGRHFPEVAELLEKMRGEE